MDFFYSIVGFFSSGGLFMYPILLVFAFGVAIAIERYVTLTMVTNENQADALSHKRPAAIYRGL